MTSKKVEENCEFTMHVRREDVLMCFELAVVLAALAKENSPANRENANQTVSRNVPRELKIGDLMCVCVCFFLTVI